MRGFKTYVVLALARDREVPEVSRAALAEWIERLPRGWLDTDTLMAADLEDLRRVVACLQRILAAREGATAPRPGSARAPGAPDSVPADAGVNGLPPTSAGSAGGSPAEPSLSRPVVPAGYWYVGPARRPPDRAILCRLPGAGPDVIICHILATAETWAVALVELHNDLVRRIEVIRREVGR